MANSRSQTSLKRPNDPALLILTSLAGGAKHGYALSRDISAFAGAMSPLSSRRVIAP